MDDTSTGSTPAARLPFYSSVALSSKRKGWGTPRKLFDARCRYVAGLPPDAPLELVPRPWVDPCATPDNALVPRLFTPEDDGLALEWRPPMGLQLAPLVLPWYVFENPPYGEPEEACPPRGCRKKRCQERGHHLSTRLPGIGDWTRKAQGEALAWGLTVDCLLPYRAAEWWGDTIRPPLELSGPFLSGTALPGELSPFHPYWPTLEWRLFRWRWLEVEVAVLAGRLHFIPEPGATKATTGAPQTGKDAAGFDSAIITFRGLRGAGQGAR